MRRSSLTVVFPLGSLAVVLLVALTGCGASHHSGATGPFAWLRPALPPAGWHVTRIHGDAALAYPPRWTSIKTDVGTASVALLGRGEQIDGYLNATPKQGTETLANWSRFRPQHNRSEGNRNVHLVATTDGRFRSGRGACVIDTYTTTKATYREIACLVSGHGSSAVVVGAAPAALWDQHAATLEQAVSSFVA